MLAVLSLRLDAWTRPFWLASCNGEEDGADRKDERPTDWHDDVAAANSRAFAADAPNASASHRRLPLVGGSTFTAFTARPGDTTTVPVVLCTSPKIQKTPAPQ